MVIATLLKCKTLIWSIMSGPKRSIGSVDNTYCPQLSKKMVDDLEQEISKHLKEGYWIKLTDREIELIDGMIEVQKNHADRCDALQNRIMADKQKAWDMERVALLKRIKMEGA
jgi:hypothetical protein